MRKQPLLVSFFPWTETARTENINIYFVKIYAREQTWSPNSRGEDLGPELGKPSDGLSDKKRGTIWAAKLGSGLKHAPN